MILIFRKCLVLFLCSLLVSGLLAQSRKRCVTNELQQLFLKSNSASGHNMQYEELREEDLVTESTEVVSIPVVVHVIHSTATENITDAQVISQIKILNEDFRRKPSSPGYNTDAISEDTKIEFFLADKDPQGIPTNGITRTKTDIKVFTYDTDEKMKYTSKGGKDPWPKDQYLNIWVCNLGDVLGYATYPVSDGVDGVVISYENFGNTGTAQIPPYNMGRTCTHEVGHWLNLLHTWGDSECGDDKVADTPIEKGPNYECPKGITSSCNSSTTRDMVENYMNFTDDNCMNIFTKGQSARMWATLKGLRKSFLINITGIKQYNSSTFRVFPNPSNGIINLPNNLVNSELSIYDSKGVLMQRQQLIPDKPLDIHEFANGIYFLILRDGANYYSEKVILQKNY